MFKIWNTVAIVAILMMLGIAFAAEDGETPPQTVKLECHEQNLPHGERRGDAPTTVLVCSGFRDYT